MCNRWIFCMDDFLQEKFSTDKNNNNESNEEKKNERNSLKFFLRPITQELKAVFFFFFGCRFEIWIPKLIFNCIRFWLGIRRTMSTSWFSFTHSWSSTLFIALLMWFFLHFFFLLFSLLVFDFGYENFSCENIYIYSDSVCGMNFG